MRKVDSEMVMEVPDTPERLSFTRSVGESSSLARGIEDKPCSSNQYLGPTSRNYYHQMKNCSLYDFNGNNAAPVDDDFLFSHSSGCSPEPSESGSLNDSGKNPELIDLSQESPSPLPCPTSHGEPRNKEDRHLSRRNERFEISGYSKPGFRDFNGDNTVLVDDDFLFSQAKIARFISCSHDTGKTYPHNSSSELGKNSVLASGTAPTTIDLSQGSPSPLPYRTRFRGPRFKEEKYLSRQSERNEINGYCKLGIRALNSTEGFGKEKGNANNSSKASGSSNNITDSENIRCNASLMPSHKETVTVKQVNSRTRNELLQSRHPELTFSQSNMHQNKADCKELNNTGNQRAPSSSLVRNEDSEIGNGSHKVSQSAIGYTKHNHIEAVLHLKKNGNRMLVRNGCISASNIARNKNDKKAKGVEDGVLASKTSNTNSSQSTHLHVGMHPKGNGRRTLMNNAHISLSSIARNNNNEGFEETGVKMPTGNSSKFMHGSIFEGRMADIGKGKEIMNEELSANSQHIGIMPSSRRSCLIPGKELAIISEMEYDTGRTSRCEATHKHVESSSLPSSFATIKCTSENMSSHLSSSIDEMLKGGTRHALSVTDKHEVATLQSGENISHIQGCFKLASKSPQHTGKRKNSFAHSNFGECSSSTVSSRISYDRRLTKPSNSRSIRSRKSVRVDTSVAPIVEISELDNTTEEENHELSDESIAKSIQLESDEVLARQLQEQFYLESPPVGTSEVESAVEWSLLQEDEDLHAFRRQNNFLQREALLPSFLGRPRFHHPSSRMSARARTQVENGIGSIRRHIRRPSMSLEERLNFLEALDAAFENANDMDTLDHFLDGQRDFDANDYEMLLALDENNHHVGASERQINNLPQSLIQNTDSGEACAVCLETPSVGDTIRHLPCLHKFHKDCIDTWLRRKRSCPICKCGIT